MRRSNWSEPFWNDNLSEVWRLAKGTEKHCLQYVGRCDTKRDHCSEFITKRNQFDGALCRAQHLQQTEYRNYELMTISHSERRSVNWDRVPAILTHLYVYSWTMAELVMTQVLNSKDGSQVHGTCKSGFPRQRYMFIRTVGSRIWHVHVNITNTYYYFHVYTYTTLIHT